MLERRQKHIAVHFKRVFYIHDGLGRVNKVIAEKLEADCFAKREMTVQHKLRRHDYPVAAFLLNSGHSLERLIGDIFAKTAFPDLRSAERNRFDRRFPALIHPAHIEYNVVILLNLPVGMAAPLHIQQMAVRIDDAEE